MNYIFFGTPEFASVVLDKLIGSGFIPKAVVCNPDRPVGRKKVVTPPPVKSLIMRHETWNIEILQPEKLDAGFRFQVSGFNPDFFIVAAYAKIVPKEILEIPRLGTIGVHPSLLPKYRGPSPIQAAILSGDEETGVTLLLLDEKIDHGPIVSSVKCQTSSKDSYKTLAEKLAELAGELLIETIPKFLAGEIKPTPQDESCATYTKKFNAEDAFINPDALKMALADGGTAAVEIDRKIRALNPEPGVWTTQNGKRLKLLEATIESGKLVIKKIQVDGEKPKVLESRN